MECWRDAPGEGREAIEIAHREQSSSPIPPSFFASELLLPEGDMRASA
jgi:hypothetical protein